MIGRASEADLAAMGILFLRVLSLSEAVNRFAVDCYCAMVTVERQ